MKFEFADKTYLLEFQRKHKDVVVHRKGAKITVKSKYPYTTARILEKRFEGDQKPNVVVEYTVGCLPTDRYSNAEGRLMALRGLTKDMTKQLRGAVWQAYEARKIQPKKPEQAQS